MAKTGRPKKQIDVNQVEMLARIGCTYSEIGAVVGCDKSLICKRFSTEVAKGHEELKMSIRRMQLQSANKGNVAMLIWLGKQYLGQKDQQRVETSEDNTLTLNKRIVLAASSVGDKESGHGDGNGNGRDPAPGAGRLPG